MAAVKAEIKRGFLRSLYRQVANQNTQTKPGDPPVATLLEALSAFQDAGFNAIKSGRIIVGTSGAGHSVSFLTPTVLNSFTQEEVFSVSEELIQLFTDCTATLKSNGQPTDDASVFNAMMADDRLQTVTSMQKDFTLLRWPSVQRQ